MVNFGELTIGLKLSHASIFLNIEEELEIG